MWGSLKTQNGHGHPPRFQNVRTLGRKIFGARGCPHKINSCVANTTRRPQPPIPPNRDIRGSQKICPTKSSGLEEGLPVGNMNVVPLLILLGHFMHPWAICVFWAYLSYLLHVLEERNEIFTGGCLAYVE